MTTLLSVGEAERLTQRIKLTASTIREGLFKLRALVDEAQNSNAWQVLGYPSWTAYLSDTLASEPMRVSREERLEIVAWLAGEGLSTRAIAPIVGASKSQVAEDVRQVSSSGHVPPTEPEDVEPIAADPVTGEVIEVPRVEEHTVTEKTRVTVGLDGKTYTTQPKPAPKVLEGDALLDYDAKQSIHYLTEALDTCQALCTPAHRNRVVSEWWPRALKNEQVPLRGRDLIQPAVIRQIADGLLELATELEVQA